LALLACLSGEADRPNYEFSAIYVNMEELVSRKTDIGTNGRENGWIRTKPANRQVVAFMCVCFTDVRILVEHPQLRPKERLLFKL
jgi:hypothetical protein